MQKKRITLLTIGVLSMVLLYSGVGAQRISSALQSYPDVRAGSSEDAAITSMTLVGLLRGYENGFFGPNDPLTRSQIAILLKRFDERKLGSLRAQMEEVRTALNLGICGDGNKGTGEECDDGNRKDEDGCSADCLTEVVQTGCMNGKYRIGERFDAEDGCNVCICTTEGIGCTEMACEKTGAGVGTEEEDEPESDITPTPSPSPISSDRPYCGNDICEYGENDLPPDRRFHCPQDCAGQEVVRHCERLKDDLLDIPDEDRACSSNDDCVIMDQTCPFITCGEAVNQWSYPKHELKLRTAMDVCRKEGNIVDCVLCPYTVSICNNGLCKLVQSVR